MIRPAMKLLVSFTNPHPSAQETEDALQIRLDEDWCHFLGTDYVFSTERLTRSGFDFSYPDVDNGLKETVAWYRAENWI